MDIHMQVAIALGGHIDYYHAATDFLTKLLPVI
jgi:hypothetical protein